MSVLNFSEGYRQHFRVVPALTEALRHKHYGLRHDVYCRDLGFEPANENGLEIDPFDRHSLHCLIRALVSGNFVGCARLVLADPGAPHRRLPFEHACESTLDRRLVDPEKIDRSKIAEISRLAILGRYRRRQGDPVPALIRSHQEEARHLRLPYLPVALYIALLAMAQLAGIETLFLLTERSLAANIKRLGGELIPVGDPIEHRGIRIPSMMNVSATIGGMNPYVRTFFEMIAEDVAVDFSATTERSNAERQFAGLLLRA
jgi:N-acyl amino acid synthase of PEP-CTERM/exosortase system